MRFTIHKLKERDYVELHYFTLEGCTEDLKHNHTIAQDTFTFTKADDSLLLKPMASHKPSNKVTPDEDLTWHQMSIGKTTLLHHMGRTGWPDQYIMALTEFYLNLESHPMRLQTSSNTCFYTTRLKSAKSGTRLSRVPTMSLTSTTDALTQFPPTFGMPVVQKGF